MDVELRHLRAFVAVAQGLSFTRAAERLFVTQPALTRTIKQLESILGATLLDRDTRRVSLTPEGVRFLEGARAALGAVDRAVSNVLQDAPLRLGFSWLLPDPWAQRAVAEYERVVGSAVSLVRTDDPLGDLERREIDVAVLRDRADLPAGVRTVRLFEERRVVVCSTASPVAERRSVDWSELEAWPFVYNSVSGTVGPWSWHDGGPSRFVETHNYDEWLESIAADRGISVVPDLATRRTIHPSIRFVPLAGAPPSTVSIGFVLDHPERLKRRFAEAAVAVVDPAPDRN
ncbi:LysR family transcriptional regulator [Promicromonospora sukumoe]|uniref:LysR family transcriptional regulator n=1 Tax=Promicromonospora sukumoe TaxID=88382 RepID=UPI0037C78AB2